MKYKLLGLVIAAVTLMICPSSVSQQAEEGSGQLSPIILIYSGFTPDWGQRLAELIKNDPRFDAEVQVIEDKATYETVVNFPRVQAVVICPLTRVQASLEDISEMTLAYFEDGGAVVGIGDACTTRYAPGLGPKVFSISGNRSLSTKKIGGRKVFQYYKRDVIPEINGELPDELVMEGYLAFYSSNKQGDYVAIPVEGTRHVLYVGEKHVPLIVAYESKGGGSSVAFPALTVQENPQRDNYYGHLFERPEFEELFLNGLKWAIDHSPRYDRLKSIAGSILDQEASRRADLAAEADRLQRRIEARRLLRLGILWMAGIAFSVVVALKLVIVRDGKE